MRFSFLIITLSFVGLLFSEAVHAEVGHHNFIPNNPSFKAVSKAYKEFNYPEAIRITKQLIRQKKDPKVAKAAAFLLGDIHFNVAENGRPLDYKPALAAFKSARARYRDSEEAIRALWKIGTIYSKQRLFYEALASFNRVIKNHPESRLVISAQFGKARTYLAWEKHEKAIAEYDLIDPMKLKHDEQIALLLGYGNTYHELNMVNTAYSYYKLVPSNDAFLAEYPTTILQYGISALRSEDYGRAVKLLSILQDRYPGKPDTLLALARIGDAWRLQGMSHRADNIYKIVSQSYKNNTDGQLAKITAAVGRLHLAGCFPRPILLSKADCNRMNPLTSKGGLEALKNIWLKAKMLFFYFDHPTPRTRLRLVERILFESMEALEQHGAYTLSLQLKEYFLEKKIHRNARKKLMDSLQQTVIKATSQLVAEHNDMTVLTVFFRHRAQFSGEILNGDFGLQIGIRLTEAGFHQEAATILRPIAESKHNNAYEKALYYLIKANVQRGAYQAAEKGLKHHIKKHPESPRRSALEIISAEISAHEGLNTQAIKKYRSWLVKYPKDKRARQVRLALARVYEENQELHQAITVYLKLLQKKDTKLTQLQLKIADLYFRLKKYKKAATHYQQSLQDSEEGPQKEWAQVQLANSYAALGQTNLGTPLLMQLAKQAEDDIIKGFAEQKTAAQE